MADGTYRMRVVRRDESRVIDSVKEIRIDRTPPRGHAARGRAVGDRNRGARGGAERPPALPRPEEQGTGLPRLPHGGWARRRSCVAFAATATATQSGTARSAAGLERTEPAPEGDYAFTVAVRDKAGNLTEAPAPLPRGSVARPGTGVSVRNFTLRGPLSAVTAGARASFEVGPVDRSFDFVVSRLGDPKAVLKGGRIGGRFGIRIPGRMRTGVYVVRVRAGGQRAVWPLAVAGLPPRSARGEARPLVVLPALTWQGLNRVDDDADGFADRLPFADSVRVDRPFDDGGLPRRFSSEVSPLLRWLDRERLPYDLTTDLALARREGPALGNAPGVAFAGSELWLPEELLGAAARVRGRRRARDGVRRGLVQAHDHPPRRRGERPLTAAAAERVRGADRAASARARRR